MTVVTAAGSTPILLLIISWVLQSKVTIQQDVDNEKDQTLHSVFIKQIYYDIHSVYSSSVSNVLPAVFQVGVVWLNPPDILNFT